MRSPSRPATVRDVAARAGVSIATVSRALRGHPNVDPRTRKLVEDAARKLSYRPSGVARSLRLRTTRTIGLIVTDIENPYFPQIVSAVEDAARDRGYAVLLADGRRDPEREIGSLEVLAERRVDGLIIASTTLTQRHRARIRDVPCPVVIVNGRSTVAAVPAVMSDNRSGGRLTAEHILSLGHRRLVYLAAPTPDHWAVRERVAGVRAVIREHGPRRAWLSVVPTAEGVEGGARAARTGAPGATAHDDPHLHERPHRHRRGPRAAWSRPHGAVGCQRGGLRRHRDGRARGPTADDDPPGHR
jgi:DNA-binding LacI/PurR family transcriptional regulator